MSGEVKEGGYRIFDLLVRLSSAAHTDETRALLSEVIREP